MKAAWTDASKEAREGDAVEANAKARTAKGMGEQIIDQLKIKKA